MCLRRWNENILPTEQGTWQHGSHLLPRPGCCGGPAGFADGSLRSLWQDGLLDATRRAENTELFWGRCGSWGEQGPCSKENLTLAARRTLEPADRTGLSFPFPEALSSLCRIRQDFCLHGLSLLSVQPAPARSLHRWEAGVWEAGSGRRKDSALPCALGPQGRSAPASRHWPWGARVWAVTLRTYDADC